MKAKPLWMNFVDYETVILAAQSFLHSHIEAKAFDCQIAYEDVADRIPLFRAARR
jgi:hypothetical protein